MHSETGRAEETGHFRAAPEMTMRELLRSHCGNRLFEWVMTLAMLGLAVLLLLWPTSIEHSAFRLLLRLMSPDLVALFFLGFGFARVAALFANGSWPKWGPWMRVLSAGGAAMLWAQMDLALLLLAPNSGTPPSPDIPVYLALTIGELISCYRVFAVNATNHRA